MKISTFLKTDLIEPNFAPTEKDAALSRLVEIAMPCLRAECSADAEKVLEALKEREAVTSTGIGSGVAIPHAKVEGLKKMLLVFARSAQGLNFQALDDAPVHLIFLVIAPPEAISNYLKLLAAISAFVKNDRNRAALQNAGTKAEMLAIIKAGETA